MTMAQRTLLAGSILLFVAMSFVGLRWGLPSRSIDSFLFPDELPWPGERIYRLAKGDSKFDPDRGADVDTDPIDRSSGRPVDLTATEEGVARVLLRYRLYTHQPDEMITMMALSGMRPSQGRFDPRLYQYGGLFIYPVGALIQLCGAAGLIDVRGDVPHYLDHPDEFGKFYIVARTYAAAWGVFGVVIVFLLSRMLAGVRAGIFAALLFTLLPVVVCMSHEGKPHLPGAVLMLAAVLFAMRCLNASTVDDRAMAWNWRLMCICCGAALGLVLSSLPILLLIPWMAWMLRANPVRDEGAEHAARANARGSDWARAVKRSIAGLTLAAIVYFVTNPYVIINAVSNRDVLRSNFGNSMAMYEIARIGDGLLRVIELTVEGATWPILIFGVVGLLWMVRGRRRMAWPLPICGLIFFVQFVLIGAGKPGEYGRFGVFPNTVLAIGAACLLAGSRTKSGDTSNDRCSSAQHEKATGAKLPVREFVMLRLFAGFVVAGWTGYHGGKYLWNFHVDATLDNSRTQLAKRIIEEIGPDGVANRTTRFAAVAEPAPYNCPPLPFGRVQVLLLPPTVNSESGVHAGNMKSRSLCVRPVDEHRPRWKWMKDPDGARRLSFHAAALRYGSPDSVRLPFGGIGRCDTPISWANKPFERMLLE